MQITRYSIKSAKIGNKCVLALVADVHGKEQKRMFEELCTLKPDIIAVAGDIEGSGDADRRTSYIVRFINDCSAIAPVFVSLGNHDVNVRNVFPYGPGAILLDNEYVSHGGLLIGGLTSGSLGKRHQRTEMTPEPDTFFIETFAKTTGFKMLLSHHPEYYPSYLKDKDIDLILSGHAHGGQWRFFGRGVFAPGQGIFPKYTSGIHDGRLIVSKGLADHNGVPRLFNPYELCIIEISPGGAE